jgi:hypothetical protein
MTAMRYIQAGKAIRSIAKALHRRQFNVDEMSDYMRRDIGLVEGRPTLCGDGFADTGSRSRSFDRLALTPCAS